MPLPVHIIGVPLDLGGNRRGVDMGPSAFRIAGIGEKISALNHPVADKGDLPSAIPEIHPHGDPHKKFIDEIARVCVQLHQIVLGSLHTGAIPLVLGGDHSLAAGSVASSADWVRSTSNQPLVLIWIDENGDMNTPSTSATGNVHGMPLAALLGHEPIELASIGANPSISPEHTVLLGIRNIDEEEKAQIRASGIHTFTMKDIDRSGIAVIAERAIAIAMSGTGGVHV